MTSNTGTIVWRAAYNAFGNATIDAASTITNNLRFPASTMIRNPVFITTGTDIMILTREGYNTLIR
jgi:hypothetical protein